MMNPKILLPVRRSAAMAIVALMVLAGSVSCSDDDAGASTIPLAEWVDRFETMCVDAQTRLSDPALTDEEYARITTEMIAEMREVSAPETMADTATEILDVIEASAQPGLTQSEIDAFDQRAIAALTALEVGDACVGGVPG